MFIEVYPKFERIPEDRMYGKTVVIVDVFCAVSSMILAIKNGATKVIPTRDAGEAVSIYGKLGMVDCVLAGEVNGEKPAGFMLGTSPLEYTQKAVGGKTIVMSTHNGTVAINGIKSAKHVLVGSIINRKAVAKRILEYGDDVIIMCAGSDGNISAEDICGAGAIVNALYNSDSRELKASDMAFISRMVYTDWKNKNMDLANTEEYRALMQAGRVDDIKICLTTDMTDTVPEYSNGIIK